MGENFPTWMKKISDDILAYCVDDQLKNGDYKIDFAEVDAVSLLVILLIWASIFFWVYGVYQSGDFKVETKYFTCHLVYRTNLPIRGVGGSVMSVIGEDSFSEISDKFVSMLCTHLHSASEIWSGGLKLLLSHDNSPHVKTYAARRYFFPLPMISDAIQSFSDERYRYLSRTVAVSEPLSAMGGVPHIRASQMAIGQLIRSYESATLYDLSIGGPTFIHRMGPFFLTFFVA